MIGAMAIWNEINLDREWSTAPQQLDPTRYVKLLQTAYDAIKKVDPNILVISAPLSPTSANISGRVMDDFNYLSKLITAGMLKYTDCVGAHHPGFNIPPSYDYNNLPERIPTSSYRGPWDNPNHYWSFKSTLEDYEKQIKIAGGNVKLCVTEFGWASTGGLSGKPTAGFEFAVDNSLADQAKFTLDAITEMQQWGWVRLAVLSNLNYGAQSNWDQQGADGSEVLYSIIGPEFVPRPVFTEIAAGSYKESSH
jgi:hypothetical protein